MTTKADQVIERAADRLRRFADRAAAEGGVKAKLAEPLAEDAAFLRKLKPSLIAARVSAPQHGRRPKAKGEGPNPFLVVGAALVVGVVLAKVIDWRSHAHPRD
jgi:hypothetical protein